MSTIRLLAGRSDPSHASSKEAEMRISRGSDVEALSALAGRIHVRATQQTSATAASAFEAAVHDQLK
jgi:hypothetical protein